MIIKIVKLKKIEKLEMFFFVFVNGMFIALIEEELSSFANLYLDLQNIPLAAHGIVIGFQGWLIAGLSSYLLDKKYRKR
jgi:hypothetical protein